MAHAEQVTRICVQIDVIGEKKIRFLLLDLFATPLALPASVRAYAPTPREMLWAGCSRQQERGNQVPMLVSLGRSLHPMLP